MATIVEESVHSLLKHPFFVVDDDVGSLQLQKILQAVVAIDDASVEIVQIAGGKTSTLKGNQRSQVGGMTGIASRIIHSGFAPEEIKP